MMPTLRGVVTDHQGGGTSPAVTLPLSTRAGDFLVAVQAVDYGPASNMRGATAGTWAARATGYDTNTNGLHHKVLTSWDAATGASGQVLTFPNDASADADMTVVVLVFDGSTVDPARPVDAAAVSAPGTAGTSHATPALTTTGPDRWVLLTAAIRTGTTFTVAGYTEDADVASRIYVSETVAHGLMASAGSTGSATFTSAGKSAVWATAAVAITGATATPQTLTPGAVATAERHGAAGILAGTPTGDLVDRFPTGENVAALWPRSYGGPYAAGGHAEVPCSSNGSGGRNYAGLQSDQLYRWAGSRVVAEVVSVPASTADGDDPIAQVCVGSVAGGLGDGTRAMFQFRPEYGDLRFRLDVNYGDAGMTAVDYDPDVHRWVGLVHDVATRRVLWQTSSDGLDWTTHRDEPGPAYVWNRDHRVQVEANRQGGTDDHFIVDNVNATPADAFPQTLTAAAVATGEAVGAPAVAPGVATLTPAGVATDEASGVPALAVGPTALTLAAVGSDEAVAAPVVLVWPVTVTAGSVAGDDTAGTPAVEPGAVALTPAASVTDEAVSLPTLTPGPVTLTPSPQGPHEAVGTPELAAGGVTLSVAAAPDGSAVGTPALGRGTVAVTPASTPTAETVPRPLVTAGVPILAPGGIAPAETFGDATVAPGGVTVDPAAPPPGERVGSPTVRAGTAGVVAVGVPSPVAVGTPTVGLEVTPRSVPSAESVPGPTVGPGPVTLTPSAATSSEAAGAPELAVGPVDVAASSAPSAQAVGDLVVAVGGVELHPAGVDAEESVGSPGVAPAGVVVVRPVGVPTGARSGAPTVARGPVNLRPWPITRGGTVQAVSVAPGPVSVAVSSVATATQGGIPAVWVGPVDVAPGAVATAETFPTPALDTSRIHTRAESIPTGARFGWPLVAHGHAIRTTPGRLGVTDAGPAQLVITDRPARLEVTDA